MIQRIVCRQWESLYDSNYSKRTLLEYETTECPDGIQKDFYDEARFALFNQDLFCPSLIPVISTYLHARVFHHKIINYIGKQMIFMMYEKQETLSNKMIIAATEDVENDI